MGLEAHHVTGFLDHLGKVPFPADQVAAHQAKLKERDTIVEKNKKLKASKKPEEPVPVLDNLESHQGKDAEGNEVTNWFLMRNPQFRHLNVCLNQIDDLVVPPIVDALKITPDDFCFTLSGNQISEEGQKKLHDTVRHVHKQRVTE